jgi:hypothetical protein
MKRIAMTLTFSDHGSTRTFSECVETAYPGDSAGEDHVAHMLLTELKVDVGPQPVPQHNATARAWLEFPNRPADLAAYFDIENSQALWRELATLMMGAEADLGLAEAYKALEPEHEPPFEDSAAINRLYYIHDKKMNLLNQAVYALVKVQDLVNRLLHESLGGDLVDTSKEDWEEIGLRRKQVTKGLERKHAAGAIKKVDYNAITAALKIPNEAPQAALTVDYRNRLMHHVRPSVDYAMFYAYVDSRLGEDIKDKAGEVVGRRHAVLARPPVQYQFRDLHTAFIGYLAALVEMLQRLSQVETLRR